MTPMKTVTMKDIRSWFPCHDPNKFLPEDWSGTILDALEDERIPTQHILWCLSKDVLIDQGIGRRFAAWCAAEALFITNFTDKRSWAAIEAAINFSNGLIGDVARDAAWAAANTASAAAWDAACVVRDTMWLATGFPPKLAPKVAARDAAWAALWTVGRDATRHITEAAATAAMWTVSDAPWPGSDPARDAALDAARAAQRAKLISMLKEESDFTLSDLLNNYPIERT